MDEDEEQTKCRTISMKELIIKYRDVFPYIIFGILTTLVNIISYWVMAHPLGCAVLLSTITAWILSVLFAFFTNRKWVFHSGASSRIDVLKEMLSFFACRLSTGLFDWVCMYVFVDLIHLNDIAIKVTSNVLVIILNYIASKFIIFKHE